MSSEPVVIVRKKPTSHTPRAMAELYKRGYRRVRRVEQWNPFARIRQDLWGFDLLAIRPGEMFLIQVTGGQGGNHSARRAKLLASDTIRDVLEAGFKAAVWSYALRGEAGSEKAFELREEAITLGACGPRMEPEPESPRKVAARERREKKRAQTRLRLSPPPPADPV